MASVTERIGQIQQPYGGYLKVSDFEKIQLNDDARLNAVENISGSLVGTAVDYLVRLAVSGKRVGEIFGEVTLHGALMAEAIFKKSNGSVGVSGASEILLELLKKVKNLSEDASIVSVCKAVTFDLYYRNPLAAVRAGNENYETVNPDKATIENIRTMTLRSVSFFEKYGPVTSTGFNFAPSGYTETVNTGDGDYLTSDTLFDMKVYRGKLTSKHTLQILMYWIMGQHSGQEIFKGITKIGLYNPRLNVAYIMDTAKISEGIIRTMEKEVICY